MREYSGYLLCRMLLLIARTYFLVSYVSELLYIHSKCMIVDDRRVIVTLFFYMLPILPSTDT